jgi:hypothetical protein
MHSLLPFATGRTRAHTLSNRQHTHTHERAHARTYAHTHAPVGAHGWVAFMRAGGTAPITTRVLARAANSFCSSVASPDNCGHDRISACR